MASMPGSRIFVGLAEEYRRAGRYEEALNTLQKGLQAHPTYLSAQIALARLYQETWRTQEAIEAFLKVLAMDRENLVAAKALSDLYTNSRNPVEAIKKLKLYRAISGDKAVDDRILQMEKEIHAEIGDVEPKAQPSHKVAFAEPSAATAEPIRPPFEPEPAFPAPENPVPLESVEVPSLEPALPAPGAVGPLSELNLDPNETVSIPISRFAEAQHPDSASPAPSLHSEDEGEGAAAPRETTETAEAAVPAEEIPPSRTLADLYYTQGFVSDARKIYEKLAVANPMDESVTRRLRVLRHPARIKAAKIERWLAAVRANAGASRA